MTRMAKSDLDLWSKASSGFVPVYAKKPTTPKKPRKPKEPKKPGERYPRLK